MENPKFKAHPRKMIKSILGRAITITFILGFFMVFADSFESAGGVFWIAAIGSAVYEYLHAVSFEVRADGLKATLGTKSQFYRYEQFTFSSGGKLTLNCTRRGTDKVETITCRCFEEKQIAELVSTVIRYRDIYFANKRSSVGKDSDGAASRAFEAMRTSKPEEEPIVKIPMPTPNPYAKKTPPEPKPSVQSIPTPEITSEPLPKVKLEYKSEPFPEVKLEYKPEPIPSVKIEPQPEKKLAATRRIPEQREFFEVFHYPRRIVVDNLERTNVLIVLILLALGFASLLALTLIASSKGEPIGIGTLLAVVIVTALLISVTLLSRIGKTKRLPSKLEIGTSLFIIDNDRYKFESMSDMRITSPQRLSGQRSMSFTYGGKRIVCNLGPAKKPSGRAPEYIDRYGTLAAMLKKRGFKHI